MVRVGIGEVAARGAVRDVEEGFRGKGGGVDEVDGLPGLFGVGGGTGYWVELVSR